MLHALTLDLPVILPWYFVLVFRLGIFPWHFALLRHFALKFSFCILPWNFVTAFTRAGYPSHLTKTYLSEKSSYFLVLSSSLSSIDLVFAKPSSDYEFRYTENS